MLGILALGATLGALAPPGYAHVVGGNGTGGNGSGSGNATGSTLWLKKKGPP